MRLTVVLAILFTISKYSLGVNILRRRCTRNALFYHRSDNHLIDSPVVKSYTVASKNSCFRECLEDEKCWSVGIKVNSSSKVLCKIFYNDRSSALLMSAHGWQFYDTGYQKEPLGEYCRSSLKANPCSQNCTCQDSCTQTGSTCNCEDTVILIGCCIDNPHDRAVPYLLGSFRSDYRNNNAKEIIHQCGSLARRKGYSIFALQFYGECYGGNGDFTKRTYCRHGASLCTKGCCRDGLGGGNENAVYIFG